MTMSSPNGLASAAATQRAGWGMPPAAAAVVLALIMTTGCDSNEVTYDPPVRSTTQLAPNLNLNFQKQGQMKAPGGGNVVSHDVLSDPTILFDNGKYRMWFTAAIKPFTDEQEMGIAYAESDDGLEWTPRLDPDTKEPELLLRPTPGAWDEGGIETPSVVKNADGKYFLFYSGDVPPRGSHSWSIGLATSDDGITWTKVGTTPVMDGRQGWEGPFFEGSGRRKRRVGGVCEPSVLYNAELGQFQMWYSALGSKNEKIAFRMGYATSTDGITWDARPEPVFEPDVDGSWDDSVISHLSVVFDPPTGYHLFYFGGSAKGYQMAEKNGAAMVPGAIGHAFSPDGISWQRDANPVLNVEPGTWEAWMVGGPTALVENDQVKLWYFGASVYNKYSFHIGLAIAPFNRGVVQDSAPLSRTVTK